MQYRNDIQGLRAVAFLLVFFFHLNADWLPGGFIGVDIFLVISGFLMTTIIHHDIKNQSFSFKAFYIKRLKRLLPAYYVLLFFIALVAPFWYLYNDIFQIRGTLNRAICFISNEVFKQGNSYFGAQMSENPLLHTWSLSIEMQFYFILPFIIYCFRKHLLLILTIITLALTFYTTHLIYNESLKTISYFSLIARIPEFLIGSIASILSKKTIKTSPAINTTIGIISLGLIVYGAMYISGNSYFPGALALVPCIGAGLLLLYPHTFINQLLTHPVLVYIGKLSYSLYLWHWPIMAFIRYNNSVYHFSLLEILFITIATCIGAAFSFYWIESKTHLWQKKRIVLYSIPFIVVMIGIVYFNPQISARYKMIPDEYAQNSLGHNSHYNGVTDTFGDRTRNDAIFLTGNSHADVLKTTLNEIGQSKHFSFTTLTSSSYPPINGVEKIKLKEHNEYLAFSQSLLPKVQTAIGNAKIIIFCAQGIHEYQELVLGLEELIQNLNADQHLIIISSFPILDKNPLIINKSIVKKTNNSYKINSLLEDQKIYQKIANQYHNVTFFDISKIPLWHDIPYINDTLSYYDANHLNTFGAKKLAEEIAEKLTNLIHIKLLKNK